METVNLKVLNQSGTFCAYRSPSALYSLYAQNKVKESLLKESRVKETSLPLIFSEVIRLKDAFEEKVFEQCVSIETTVWEYDNFVPSTFIEMDHRDEYYGKLPYFKGLFFPDLFILQLRSFGLLVDCIEVKEAFYSDERELDRFVIVGLRILTRKKLIKPFFKKICSLFHKEPQIKFYRNQKELMRKLNES